MEWPKFGNNTEARRADSEKPKEKKKEEPKKESTYKPADYYSGKGFDKSTEGALKEAGVD